MWLREIHFNMSDVIYIKYIRREHTYNSNLTPTYNHRRYLEMNSERQKGEIQIYLVDSNIIS